MTILRLHYESRQRERLAAAAEEDVGAELSRNMSLDCELRRTLSSYSGKSLVWLDVIGGENIRFKPSTDCRVLGHWMQVVVEAAGGQRFETRPVHRALSPQWQEQAAFCMPRRSPAWVRVALCTLGGEVVAAGEAQITLRRSGSLACRVQLLSSSPGVGGPAVCGQVLLLASRTRTTPPARKRLPEKSVFRPPPPPPPPAWFKADPTESQCTVITISGKECIHGGLWGTFVEVKDRLVHDAPCYQKKAGPGFMFKSSGTGKWVVANVDKDLDRNLGYLRFASEGGLPCLPGERVAAGVAGNWIEDANMSIEIKLPGDMQPEPEEREDEDASTLLRLMSGPSASVVGPFCIPRFPGRCRGDTTVWTQYRARVGGMCVQARSRPHVTRLPLRQAVS